MNKISTPSKKQKLPTAVRRILAGEFFPVSKHIPKKLTDDQRAIIHYAAFMAWSEIESGRPGSHCLLLSLGRFFDVVDPAKGELKSDYPIFKKRLPNRCFINARLAIHDSLSVRGRKDGPAYCEGLSLHSEIPIAVWHAWSFDPLRPGDDPVMPRGFEVTKTHPKVSAGRDKLFTCHFGIAVPATVMRTWDVCFMGSESASLFQQYGFITYPLVREWMRSVFQLPRRKAAFFWQDKKITPAKPRKRPTVKLKYILKNWILDFGDPA